VCVIISSGGRGFFFGFFDTEVGDFGLLPGKGKLAYQSNNDEWGKRPWPGHELNGGTCRMQG